MKTLTEKQIAELADEALNVMCAYVQEKLGQTDGGPASIYWSDDSLVDVIRQYVRHETFYLPEE